MKAIYSMFLLLLFVVIGCNEKFEDDLPGRGLIEGKLFYKNTYLGHDDSLALKKGIIKIAVYPSDKKSFLYSVMTDTLGGFSFNGLDFNNNRYEVFFKDTVGDILFFAADTLDEEIQNLTLIAKPDAAKRGMAFTILDSAGTGPVYGADICIFTNEVVFQTDTCSGSTYRLKSNETGNAFISDIPARTYYVLVKYSSGKLRLRGRDTITIKEGISIRKLALIRY